MATPRNGSLLARPPNEERREASPSDSSIDNTKNAPSLNATKTTRWKISAVRTATADSPASPARESSQFHAPMAVIAANM